MEHGYSCAAAGRSLGISGALIGRWKGELEGYSADAFRGHGKCTAEQQRIHELESENRRLRMERDILKSHGLLRHRTHMRYQFIEKQKKAWPITLMCEVLRVSRSGYYDWAVRDLSEQSRLTQELDTRIQAIFAKHRYRYGAPRITKTLRQEGCLCSENRIARRMRALNLRAIQAKKFKVTTDSQHARPVAPDLLKQDFRAGTRNQKWTTDITYVWTAEGWLYLAVVMDLYSRAIVEWAMSPRMKQQLVCDALTMALFRRQFPKGTILHSDRGSQYCSTGYQQLIRSNGLRCSMGQKPTVTITPSGRASFTH